ncbi:MAG: leucyl aminopeptidase family protein [Planctomycetes bacterium]|nr:leucyl aminopeptidase family protein [Planctomycetota bacterium]
MHFSFPSPGRPLPSVDHLLVVAPKACFGPRARGARALTQLLGKELAALAMELGREAAPGLLGGTATSRTAAGKRLTVGALPDEPSRHAAASRAEGIRKVTAAAHLPANGSSAVLLVLDDAAHALAAANAIGRALPTFTSKSAAKTGGKLAIHCVLRDGRPVALDAHTRDVVARAREAAHLVDTPPTELDPAAFAAAAKRLLRPLRTVTVREITGDALLRAKLGGIHAVGRCARSAPRLLIATAGGRRGPHIALVGKGVTYDTGGLHLKSRGHMETMKSDMGGAAAVLGAFAVLARKAPCRLSLLLCLAENAIGPAAYKPDDVLTMHSGKTVEINNTDAEGRLLLADGCSYAARVLKADVVLDAATLTGAQGVATGDLHAAVVANDDEVEQALLAAGRDTGDLCWALPCVPEFYRSEFTSPIADMRNSVKSRSNAQVSCAAEFVHWHLDGQKARWGHVDLASPSFRGDRGTGFGVALLDAAVRRLAAR